MEQTGKDKSQPKVWNKRDPNCPKDAVYVGRPTKWGNPFSHQAGTSAKYKVASREDAVLCYAEWLVEQLANNSAFLAPLKGKDLVCWCAPKVCHADILRYYANL